jgi:hypothetical protein
MTSHLLSKYIMLIYLDMLVQGEQALSCIVMHHQAYCKLNSTEYQHQTKLSLLLYCPKTAGVEYSCISKAQVIVF